MTFRSTPLLSLLLLTLTALGCSAAGHQSPSEKLQEAVFRYNNGVRWQNYVVSSEYIPAAERVAWLERRQTMGKEIKVLEWSIDDVKHIEDASRADVMVTFAFTRQSSNTVESATFLQDWRYGKNKQWLLEGQKRVERKAREFKLEDRF